MIKINLIPVKEKKKRKEFMIVSFAIVIFVFIALGLFWIYVQRIKVKSDLNFQIKQIDEESKGYQEKINEVKELENKQASLEALKKTIKGISEVQRKVVVAIDQLAVNLPEGVWLTNIGQGLTQDSNKFTVDGYAFTRSSLQNYYNALQKPGGSFRDSTLDIKNISASVGNNKQIIQFEIITKVADQNP